MSVIKYCQTYIIIQISQHQCNENFREDGMYLTGGIFIRKVVLRFMMLLINDSPSIVVLFLLTIYLRPPISANLAPPDGLAGFSQSVMQFYVV
jgi:hypothetical protein